MKSPAHITGSSSSDKLDAVIIGAGFAGLYMLHSLRDRLGLNVRLYDAAGGVGGTWYWNRYPGARSDSESFVYCYSFSNELLQEWEWSERYPRQPEILEYLNHVADRFELRRDIQLDTRVTGATFHEAQNEWEIETDRGERISAQFLITGLGLLSATNVPDFKGLDSFEGQWLHTGAWPTEGVDLGGKRVGIIGTGSTGVQLIPAVAEQADHVTVFQRSPQYSVPARHGPISRQVSDEVKRNYGEIWQAVRNSTVAFGFEESETSALAVSESQRNQVYEAAWEKGGGFRFMFGTFSDIATDRQANDTAAEFIRGKIREIVEDPALVEALLPTDLYAKRPLCDAGFYATFNRDNVSLVDVRRSPIREITPGGIRTADGEYALDLIIFATGFDAVTGNFTPIDIRGRKGIKLKDKWAEGPSSYLGIANAGFPNMFMITGPAGPFTNLPPTIETQVEWITDLIGHMRQQRIASVEADLQAEAAWMDTCREIASYTLFPLADSWIFGANIPGKPNTVMFYMAGLGAYRQKCAEVVAGGYEGFAMRRCDTAGERDLLPAA